MRDYLKFPSQNYVGKKLSKKYYIQSANLTTSEEKWLISYLESIDILYSFPYNDGEIIVLLANYSISTNSFSLDRLVKAIAQSIPYKILLIVKCEGVIRFFSFYETPNILNKGRSRVFSIVSSSDIVLLEKDEDLVTNLRKVAFEASSASELDNGWKSVLCNGSPLDQSIVYDTFQYSVKRDKELTQREKTFERIIADSQSGELYSIKCDMSDDFSFDIDEFADCKIFVEFCAYHSRGLFEEFSKRQSISEEEWIRIYLNACSTLANYEFNRNFDSISISIISYAFWNGIDEYYDSSDYYDLEELKEILFEHFEKDTEE